MRAIGAVHRLKAVLNHERPCFFPVIQETLDRWSGDLNRKRLTLKNLLTGVYPTDRPEPRARRCLVVIAWCASQERSICPRTTVGYQSQKSQRLSEAISVDAGFS